MIFWDISGLCKPTKYEISFSSYIWPKFGGNPSNNSWENAITRMGRTDGRTDNTKTKRGREVEEKKGSTIDNKRVWEKRIKDY